MADNDERRRILDMLAAGQINADQAAELLRALEGIDSPKAVASGQKSSRFLGARMLRISVDAMKPDGSGARNVRVNVPLGLAKFASRFLPPDARTELEGRGINLAELLDALDDDAPNGAILDIDTTDQDTGKTAKITVEVV